MINYFKCPYAEDRDLLTEYGSTSDELWKHIKWYDEHWTRDPSCQPPDSHKKWSSAIESRVTVAATDAVDVD